MKYFSFDLISYLKRNFNAVNIISKKKKNKFTKRIWQRTIWKLKMPTKQA